MAVSRSLILKLGGYLVGALLEALYFLFPAATALAIEATTGLTDIAIVTLIMEAIAVVGVIVIALVSFMTIWQHYGLEVRRKSKTTPEGSQVVSERSQTPSTRPEPIYSSEQKDYRKKVRTELFKIRQELKNTTVRQAIQFQSWNSFPQPDPRPDDIHNPTQFRAIENFSTVMSRRNDNLKTPAFSDCNDDCIAHYVIIRKTGFLEPDSPEPKLVFAEADELKDGVKQVIVRFPHDIKREHGVRFHYIKIRNDGSRTADDVKVRCDDDDMRFIPLTGKPSYGVDFEGNETPTEFDERGVDFFAVAINRDHMKVKDEIAHVNPGLLGESFVLFFTLEGYDDCIFIPAHTLVSHNIYGGVYGGIVTGHPEGLIQLYLHLSARDIEDSTTAFAIAFRKWDSFDVVQLESTDDL